jgi:hypothetical protein
VTTGAGMVEVQAPRVDDRREGERASARPSCRPTCASRPR